ncbi:hypothetical protein C8N42_12332 [Celeribacter persicus]|uniref:Uncharacterized protein n=1 Tax=Celeribacter persicus TaxID=1651082 RepID=A0A2T5H571_9RHOB|nr:hypothetical protein C8N42_12332 [Celeribacter persicus]
MRDRGWAQRLYLMRTMGNCQGGAKGAKLVH